MDYFVIFYSLFFIIMGLLAKRYPNLIAGYNTMSAKKKKHIEIDKVSSLLRKAFIASGISVVILYYFFKFLNLHMIAGLAPLIPIVILLGSLVLSQKYDHNPKTKFEKVLPLIICIGVSLFIFGTIFPNTQPTQISLGNDKIVFSGSYGVEINYNDIDTIEKLESLPHIKIRTNGSAIGGMLKGHFRLDNYGSCRLFIDGFHPPFIIITKRDGKKIIFNAPQEDTDELLKTYQALQKSLPN